MALLLQLLPPAHRLGPAAADLADSAQAVGAVAHDFLRLTTQRPLWDAARLTTSSHHHALAIHAIGDAVMSCLGCRQPVVFTPSGTVTSAQHLALATIARTAPTLLAAPHPVLFARIPRWLRRSIETHYIAPTYRLPPQRVARDGQLRKRLGFTPHDRVLLAAGVSDRFAHHELALWAAAILALLDPAWHVLILGTGPSLPRLIRFARSARHPRLLTLAQRIDPALAYADLLPAADIVVDTSLPPTTAPSRWLIESIAAEVPVLTTCAHPHVPAALQLPPTITPKALARRLLDLTNGTGLQQHVEVVAGVAHTLRGTRPEPVWSALLERLTPTTVP